VDARADALVRIAQLQNGTANSSTDTSFGFVFAVVQGYCSDRDSPRKSIGTNTNTDTNTNSSSIIHALVRGKVVDGDVIYNTAVNRGGVSAAAAAVAGGGGGCKVLCDTARAVTSREGTYTGRTLFEVIKGLIAK
jgi:hypothetical protein